MAKAKAHFLFDEENKCYQCIGNWSILALNDLLSSLNELPILDTPQVTISGLALSNFDSSGALTLSHCINFFKTKKKTINLIDFDPAQRDLLKLITNKQEQLTYTPLTKAKKNFLYRIGKETFAKLHQVDGFIILLGDLSCKLFELVANWRRFQFSSIVANIGSAGIQALPIIGLLSFLIGIVLAYQMGLQLQTYGANSFIAYLSGMAIFREFAPLITAIIIAGRTSSAFTAQIGTMKINEEIDALRTLGLSPTVLLVMPKVLGLLLVFPLIIFWADVFSFIGAMVMSKWMLNISFIDFLHRLRDAVGLKQMLLGLYKAPTFAILIALVGCFQGFRVEAIGQETIGSQTTKSVVQALFLIIIADAIYSIIYSWMDL